MDRSSVLTRVPRPAYPDSSAFDIAKHSPPLWAISVLLDTIRDSRATTAMGLHDELRQVSDEMIAKYPRYKIALSSGFALFMRYVTRTSLEIGEFDLCKQTLIERGMAIVESSDDRRLRIAAQATRFIKDGMVILTHGFSRAVVSTVLEAAKSNVRFSVIVTQSSPGNEGAELARVLTAADIDVTLIYDTAVGYAMERVDLVMVGAEGVVESGGIINKIGTYQMSVVANALKKPLYVLTECFKFVRMYPLNQRELAVAGQERPLEGDDAGITLLDPAIEYTPPHLITLLCTDIGVFTPSAVSDELIKLFA